MQTLPSLLLQTCLIYQHGLLSSEVTIVPIGLAIAQLVTAGVTISLTTLVLSMPTTTIVSTSHAKCSGGETARPAKSSFSGHQCLITAVRTICLLWCRTVAVGVFMTEFHVWTLIVFGVHWCIALLWLVLQDSASELLSGQAAPSPAVSLFRRALVAYLLVFDWPPRYQPKHSGWVLSKGASTATAVIPAAAAGSWMDVIGLGGEPRSVAVALYYGISGVENAAMLSLWFHFAPPSALVPPVARLTTLATCTAALTLGVLCVVASTQGPDEESSSSANVEDPSEQTVNTKPASIPSISGPTTSTPQPPCAMVQEREIRTVVAQVHPVHNSISKKTARLTQSALSMAANHSHPIEPPPPPPPPESTWMEQCRDDESSNSRNTNTLDGGILGSGSGGSCPSPIFNMALSPAVNMSTHPVTIRRSPFRELSSAFTASQVSSSKPSLVKRPYVSSGTQQPLSSTPRVGRLVKTERRRRKRNHHHHNHQRSSCHCRLFDDYGILIKENGTLCSGTKSSSHHSNTLSGQFRIMCAKCLGAHDPLLTTCDSRRRSSSHHQSRTLPSRHHHQTAKMLLDTSICSTTYPSDTEITCTRKSVSSSSSSSSPSETGSMDSDATYTTWPPQAVRVPSMELLMSENGSPWNYVQAWLANANHVHVRHHHKPATTTTKRTTKRLRHHQIRHQTTTNVYSSAYCTVPPRLGQSVKELSLVRRQQTKTGSIASTAVMVEHHYSTPTEIVV